MNNLFKKLSALFLALAIAVFLPHVTGLADKSQIADFTLPAVTGAYNINVCPGSDPTQLNFAWFTQNSGEAQIKLAKAEDMNGGNFPDSAVIQNAAQSKVFAAESGNPSAPTGEYSNFATVTGLTPAARYSYSISDGGGNWSPVYNISALPADGSLNIAAFGDPQIATSEDIKRWGNMMSLAAQNSGLDMILSLGDQIDDAGRLLSPGGGEWTQYNGFFNGNGNTVLQNYPLTVVKGNHDHMMGEYYGFHFNQPNRGASGATQYANDGDYWFTAGSVLFIALNANDNNADDHDQFMAQAVAANPNVKWKAAFWHQSAYSQGAHSTFDDWVSAIRGTFPRLMDKYGIDVVLQGHDHIYTRTAQMLGGNPVDPVSGDAITLKGNSGGVPGGVNNKGTYITSGYPNTATDPKGTVYFTLDSGSGSKYYDYNSAADHSFSAVTWQGYTPTYSYISFTDTSFTVNTYSSADYTLRDQTLIDSYTINKTGGVIKISINGKIATPGDVQPEMVNDRVFVPLRFVAENLGCTVNWNKVTQAVTITQGNYVYTHVPGSGSVTRSDGKTTVLDAPSFLENDRTMVSIRLISEALGYDVNWDSGTNTVFILLP